MDDSAAAAATWDRLAARYGGQERHELAAIDAALALAAPQPGERLVDLATGTGLLLRRLAAGPVRPREAIGVDRSPGMLARVGELPQGWSTLSADARAVPLADGCADVVTCAYLLQLLEAADRAAVLAEARRLLAPGPGSRLVVVTTWVDGRATGAAELALGAATAAGADRGLRAVGPRAEVGLGHWDPPEVWGASASAAARATRASDSWRLTEPAGRLVATATSSTVRSAK
jgi:SAM-dependent methyltransferase